MAKTRRSKKGQRTSDAIKEQARQLKRLQAATTDRTRRDARAKLLAALRKTRDALDAEHPVARKKPKRAGPLSDSAKRRRWRGEGRVRVAAVDLTHRACQKAGVRCHEDPRSGVWAPGWADVLARRPGAGADLEALVALLGRCNRSQKARREAVSDALLRSTPAGAP